MLFVDTSIIHHSAAGVFILCKIWYLLIYSFILIIQHNEAKEKTNLELNLSFFAAIRKLDTNELL